MHVSLVSIASLFALCNGVYHCIHVAHSHVPGMRGNLQPRRDRRSWGDLTLLLGLLVAWRLGCGTGRASAQSRPRLASALNRPLLTARTACLPPSEAAGPVGQPDRTKNDGPCRAQLPRARHAPHDAGVSRLKNGPKSQLFREGFGRNLTKKKTPEKRLQVLDIEQKNLVRKWSYNA